MTEGTALIVGLVLGARLGPTLGFALLLGNTLRSKVGFVLGT